MYHSMNDMGLDLIGEAQKVGQSAIDSAASALGIEKGSTIDNITTGAAQAGRDIGIIPDASQAAGQVIDAATGLLVPAPQASSGSGVGTSYPGGTATGSASQAKPGIISRIPPVGWGAGAAAGTYLVTKSLVGSLIAGAAVGAVTHYLRKRAEQVA